MSSASNRSQSSAILTQLYSQRRQNFIDSLQSILTSVSQDKIVRQMLQDKTSGRFITQRLEEIIIRFLTSDREDYIDGLLQKIQAYEAKYSEENLEIVKLLGNKMMSISNEQNGLDVQRARSTGDLLHKISSLQAELSSTKHALSMKEEENVVLRVSNKTSQFRTDSDPASPTYLHLYTEVDLTDFKKKLSDSKKENIMIRSMVSRLQSKIIEISELIKSKTSEANALLIKRTKESELSLLKERRNYAQLQEKYEVTILPEMRRASANSVQNLQASLEKKAKEVDDLSIALQSQKRKDEEKITKASETIESLQRSVETLREEVGKAEKEKDSKDNENKALKTKIESVESELNEKVGIISEMQSESSRVTSEKLALQKRIESLTDNLSQLSKEGDNLAKRVEESSILKAKIEDLLKSEAILKEDLKQSKALFEDIRAREDMEAKSLKEETRKNEKMEVECKDMVEKINEKEQLIKETAVSLKELERKDDESSKKIGLLAKKITEYENIISASDTKAKELTAKLEATSKRLRETEEEIKSRIAEAKQKDTDVVFLRKKVADLTSSQNFLTGKHEEEICALKAQLETEKKSETQFQNQLDSAKSASISLNSSIENLKSEVGRLKAALEKSEAFTDDLQKRNEGLISDLKKASETLREYKDIHNGATIEEAKSIAKEANEAVEKVNAIRQAIGIGENDSIDKSIQNLIHNSENFDQITSLVGENVIENVKQLISERERISTLLSKPADITTELGSIIERQNQMVNEAQNLADFIIQLLKIIASEEVRPEKVSIPLRTAQKEQIMRIVTEAIAGLKSYQSECERVIRKAKELGYSGSDCIEASEYIGQRMSDIERQQTMQNLQSELDEVRKILEEEKSAHEKDNSSKRQKIADLRASLVKQSEQSIQRETELTDQLHDAETKARELSDGLQSEKRLREELGRIGAGLSADKKLLSTKLTDKEMKFITFVESIMQRENQTIELHDKLKQARVQQLGQNLE